MERIWLGVKLGLLVLAGIFVIQNLSLVEVRLLNWSVTLPMPLLIAAVYLLGMASGRTLMGLMRRLGGRGERD